MSKKWEIKCEVGGFACLKTHDWDLITPFELKLQKENYVGSEVETGQFNMWKMYLFSLPPLIM